MASTNEESITLEGTQNLFGKIKLEGVHEGSSGDIRDLLEKFRDEFGDWSANFNALFNTIIDVSVTLTSLRDSIVDSNILNGLSSLGKNTFQEQNGDATGSLMGLNENKETEKKANVSAKVKIEELNKLSANFSLPAAALYWKLCDIEQVIAGKGNKKEEKGGPLADRIKGFLKGLTEGASGIMQLAVALFAFSAAVVVFNFVDWWKALAGIGLFTVFTIGMIFLAKVLGKEMESFKKFALSSLLMTGALIAFAVALVIMTMVVKGGQFFNIGVVDLGLAIIGIGLFLAYTVGLAFLANFLNKKGKDFSDFAKSSLLMTVALIAFSVALVIMTAVAKGSEILGLGGVDMGLAIGTTALFLVFVAAFVGLAILANQFSPNLKEFVISSLLMTASLLAFSLTLSIISALASGIEMLGLVPFNWGAIWATMGMFVLFIGAYIGLAYLANSFAPNILIFTVTSLIMAVSLAAFGFALSMVVKAITDDQGNNLGLIALEGLGIFALFVVSFGAICAAASTIAPFIAVGSVAIMMAGMAAILMGKAMQITSFVMRGGKTKDEDGNEVVFEPYSQETSKRFFSAVGSFLHDMISSFKITELLKGVAKLALLNVASMAVLGIANVLKKVLKVQKDMDANPIRSDVFVPFIEIIGQLIDVTGNMNRRGAEALKAASAASKDIAQAVNFMFDAIEKANKYDFQTSEGKAFLDKVMFNMSQVSEVFIDKIFVPVMEKFKGLKSKSLKAIESFPKFTEFLNGLVETNEKIATSFNKPIDLDNVRNLVTSFDLFGKIKMPGVIKQLEGIKVDKIDKVANGLNKIAESLEKISKNIPDKDAVNRIAQITGNAAQEKKSKGWNKIEDAPNMSSGNNNSVLYEIKNLLEKWNDENGDRPGIYVSNIEDISIPVDKGPSNALPKRVIKIANAW